MLADGPQPVHGRVRRRVVPAVLAEAAVKVSVEQSWGRKVDPMFQELMLDEINDAVAMVLKKKRKQMGLGIVLADGTEVEIVVKRVLP